MATPTARAPCLNHPEWLQLHPFQPAQTPRISAVWLPLRSSSSRIVFLVPPPTLPELRRLQVRRKPCQPRVRRLLGRTSSQAALALDRMSLMSCRTGPCPRPIVPRARRIDRNERLCSAHPRKNEREREGRRQNIPGDDNPDEATRQETLQRYPLSRKPGLDVTPAQSGRL